jgi:hypothetical protein
VIYFLNSLLQTNLITPSWRDYCESAIREVIRKADLLFARTTVDVLVADENLLAILRTGDQPPDVKNLRDWATDLRNELVTQIGGPADCAFCLSRHDAAKFAVADVSSRNLKCLAPMIKVFDQTRAHANNLAHDWGSTKENSRLSKYHFGVGVPDVLNGPWITTSPDEFLVKLEFHERTYGREHHYLLRFLLMHEWLSHALTSHAGPVELLDDFSLPWQVEVFRSGSRASRQERAAAIMYVERRFQDGWGAFAKEIRRHLEEAIYESMGCTSESAHGLSWKVIGQLALEASIRLQERGVTHFLRPLEIMWDTRPRHEFERWIDDVVSSIELGFGLRPFQRARLIHSVTVAT